VPNAPTIGVVTVVSGTSVSVAFTAPSNVGGSAITSYTVIVTDSSSGATFTSTGASSPRTVTGLTNGNTYTARVFAVNSYGPSAFSAPSGSFVPSAPRLYSWGRNLVGSLGLDLSAATTTSSPVQVGSLSVWAQVSASSQNTGAVRTNGTLWTWGDNSRGQLGQGYSYSTFSRSSPVQIGALTDWARVSTGGGYAFAAVKTTGTLWTWGANDYGQLGQNNLTFRSSPTQVGSLTDWSQVSVGGIFSFAIKTNGTLWAWGRNGDGQLGQNNTINRSSPVQIGALTDWAQVAAGNSAVCVAVKTNGTLWSWGSNNSGQLGQNISTFTKQSSPVQVGALTNWARVSAGNDFCAAVKTDGTIWVWGANQFGQLGQNDVVNRSSPVQVGALTNWSQVSTGFNHCAVSKTDGTLWTWGSNFQGQLGINVGAFTYRSSPVQVGALTAWKRTSAGGDNTFAILD
jgi:alpha-tubulin suppressor-like RCC1 family protein